MSKYFDNLRLTNISFKTFDPKIDSMIIIYFAYFCFFAYYFFIENKNTDLSASILLSIHRVAENIVLPILKTVSGMFLIILISTAILVLAKFSALLLIFGLLLGFLLAIVKKNRLTLLQVLFELL